MLIKNNKYTLTVKIGGQTFSDYFYTRLEPLYATVESIRSSDVGNNFDSITDEDILLKIHEESIEALNIANRKLLDWKESKPPPYPVMKYVIAKTKLDLLKNRQYYTTSRYKSASLSDFDIKSPDYSQIQPVMDDLKSKVTKWKRKIAPRSPKAATKASVSDPYPMRRDDLVDRSHLGKSQRVKYEAEERNLWGT